MGPPSLQLERKRHRVAIVGAWTPRCELALGAPSAGTCSPITAGRRLRSPLNVTTPHRHDYDLADGQFFRHSFDCLRY